MSLGIKDYTNTSAVSRTYRISNYVPVSGLVDPALARTSRSKGGDNETVYRQFFFNKSLYSNYTDVSISQMSQSVQGGQGWLYGPLAKANGSAANGHASADAEAIMACMTQGFGRLEKSIEKLAKAVR